MIDNNDTDENRFDRLTSVIDHYFGNADIFEESSDSANYANSTTGMFEVTDITTDGCTLQEINYDFVIAPVIFPKAILDCLREKDVFLATLGQKRERWEALYLSPPYEQLDFCESADGDQFDA